MSFIVKKWFKKLLLALAVVIVGCFIGYYVYISRRGNIYDFNYHRDAHEIADLFKKDLYWLSTNENYSPDFMMRYRSPNQIERRYIGKLNIKVLREKGLFCGFVAYYMRDSVTGMLLFLAVKHDLRGKKYGEVLMRYALQALWDLGAERVELFTRVTNYRSQALYRRLGMQEIEWTPDGLVKFELKRPAS